MLFLTFNLLYVYLCEYCCITSLSPQELPKLLQDLATTDAELPWNKSKNRFPNIKPCKLSSGMILTVYQHLFVY